jgi:carboxypeptidase C (cathepsin A)
MKKTLLLFLFIISHSFYAQEYVFGKITSEQNIELSGVLILNTRTDEKIYSDSDGNFMISAKNNDALRFVKQKFDRITYSIKPEDFKNSIKITLIKSVVVIEEVEIKTKLTGNLREDARRVESVRKVKLNKEIAKYIAEKSDPEIIKPRGGEFVQPVGQGFSVGKVSNQADQIDLAEDFLEILGEDYFTDLGLKKSEISGFIFHVMSSLDLKNAYKYGYLKGNDIAQFRKQAEIKINDFRKLK